MTTEKKKMGRPKKEVHGVALWIPSEYVDAMQKFLDVLKGYKPVQQVKQQ